MPRKQARDASEVKDVFDEAKERHEAEAQKPAEEKKPFEPVRHWSDRFVQPVAYRRFTDADLGSKGAVCFQFTLPQGQRVPDQDIIKIMQENKLDCHGNPTGLKFTETRKHGKIWTLPNDVEGRTLADRIEMRLRRLAAEIEQATDRGR
jgi:hypothetical protein